MVVRFIVITGILLGGLSWVLLVPMTPPDFQASPGGAIIQARAVGFVPKVGEMAMSKEIGHGVFEVPDTDAVRLATVTAAGDGGTDMKGMPMGEQEKMLIEQQAPAVGDGIAEMKGMPMDGQAEKLAEQPTPTMAMGDDTADMKGMPMGAQTEKLAEQPTPTMGGGIDDMKGMPMGAQAEKLAEQPMPTMAMGEPAGHDEEVEEGRDGGSGLTIMNAAMARMASRTVELEMAEWGFSPGNLTVRPGEIIRFVVRNTGNVPHEFMFMPGAAMEAVNYRLERADWNLLEHEAPFEQSIVLPGDSFEAIIRVDQPGTWMFMCMFPYHMQFGMMGMMMTEGASMDGMKM